MGVSVMQLVAPLVVSLSIFAAFGSHGVEQPDGTAVSGKRRMDLGAVPRYFHAGRMVRYERTGNLQSLAERAIAGAETRAFVDYEPAVSGDLRFLYRFLCRFRDAVKTQFPEVQILHYAFFGPFIGALARSAGGAISDRLGGTRVTLVNFILMAIFSALLFLTLPSNGVGGNFIAFFAVFPALFLTAGLGVVQPSR